MFRDRADAAQQLIRALASHRGKHPLVLAVPRGAVPMAQQIAHALAGDLDVVLVRKLAAPDNPEFAIGAIDETGWTWLNRHAQTAGASDAYIEQARKAQLALIQERRARYTPLRPPLDPAGRDVIVVDDGLATGATMIAALHAVRARHPARLTCAVPVAARGAAARVRQLCDTLVCLSMPEEFYAVGQFYENFAPVEDSEVEAVLANYGALPTAKFKPPGYM